jgi:hypothetical protein
MIIRLLTVAKKPRHDTDIRTHGLADGYNSPIFSKDQSLTTNTYRFAFARNLMIGSF